LAQAEVIHSGTSSVTTTRDDVHHEPAHSSALQHHFDNMEQQREAGTIGMWVFLVTEIMFFGGMFLAYLLYRAKFPLEFAAGSYNLDITLGAINTAILIGSSLTMALAVYNSQIGNRKWLIWFLAITLLLGLAFLGIKAVEYGEKFSHHTYPGAANFHVEKLQKWEADHREEIERAAQQGYIYNRQKIQMYYFIYFAMTGVHALHMVVGAGILLVLIFMAWRGRFSPEYHAPVEISGLYWHFVDIVWIFLFPLLYLIGRH
jgi:cytochrome c oxidase subunit III